MTGWEVIRYEMEIAPEPNSLGAVQVEESRSGILFA